MEKSAWMTVLRGVECHHCATDEKAYLQVNSWGRRR